MYSQGKTFIVFHYQIWAFIICYIHTMGSLSKVLIVRTSCCPEFENILKEVVPWKKSLDNCCFILCTENSSLNLSNKFVCYWYWWLCICNFFHNCITLDTKCSKILTTDHSSFSRLVLCGTIIQMVKEDTHWKFIAPFL